jgi:ammonium transporter, Amt family
MTSIHLIRAGLLALLATVFAIEPSLAQEAAKEAAPAAEAADAQFSGDTAWMLDLDRPRPHDDDPGPRALLWRHGPQEERACDRHAVFRRLLPDERAVACHRLFDRLRRQPERGLNAYFGGFGKMFLSPASPWIRSTGTIPEWVFFTFQMTFAIITPALILGAVAERMKFSAVLWFTGSG